MTLTVISIARSSAEWSANGQQMPKPSAENLGLRDGDPTENSRKSVSALVYTERVGGSSPSPPTISGITTSSFTIFGIAVSGITVFGGGIRDSPQESRRSCPALATPGCALGGEAAVGTQKARTGRRISPATARAFQAGGDGIVQAAFQPITAFVSRYSAKPCSPHSRPLPERL